MVTAIPITAALLTTQPAAADPGFGDLSFLGEIATGSTNPEVAVAEDVGAPSGSSLGLGTGSAYSGSVEGVGNGGASSGSSLGVEPKETADVYVTTGSALTGSAGTGSAGTGGGTNAAADIALPGANRQPAAGNTLGESMGLESGSILTACAGSAVVGSAAIGLGLLTGSGLGSGMLGPGFVPGSSGLVGPGSAGAGSVVLGSAVSGSALFTCLLLLPVAPDVPGIPLMLPPSVPPVAPVAAPVIPPVPESIPPVPVIPPPLLPVHISPAMALPVPEPLDWNTMQMMTVMIITILAAARARLSRSRRG
ncbi:hypothetical protein AB0N05_32125 [Nocardia sp. NPDC051030]|uniref:hypothetical protein n=1 Tax=Nocardia sp. NPDC051030 TaxID=3155162 RepID=UPI003437138D